MLSSLASIAPTVSPAAFTSCPSLRISMVMPERRLLRPLSGKAHCPHKCWGYSISTGGSKHLVGQNHALTLDEVLLAEHKARIPPDKRQ